MGYIFFVEELDCFNTEQCCAFLYKFMEYIQIARITKRTLVLPNIYLSPRDNKKILSEKRIVIKKVEYICIDNFIDIDEIRKICDVITVTDYHQYILDNNIRSLLISKPNIDLPYSNNKLFTYVGKLDIEDIIQVNFSSFNILQVINNEILNDSKSLIIYDYNRSGNPNWYNSKSLEYNLIRRHIVFNDVIKNKAEEFIMNNNLSDTLMFHWRRGDRENVEINIIHEKSESETKNWFKYCSNSGKIDNVIVKLDPIINKYNIKQLLLITNSGNEKELDDFKFYLEYKKVKLIEINNNIQFINIDYHLFDILSIEIGSRCKYHVHSPINYDRMSMYGRWMLEGKSINQYGDQWLDNVSNELVNWLK
jgi:hypothetical protein